MNTSAALFHFPPIDLVPEVFRGKDLLMVRFAYVGDLAEGERLAAPLRAAAPVYLDNLGRMVRADMGLIHNDPSDPGPSWTRGTLLDDIDDAFVTTVLEQVAPGTAVPGVRGPPPRRQGRAWMSRAAHPSAAAARSTRSS